MSKSKFEEYRLVRTVELKELNAAELKMSFQELEATGVQISDYVKELGDLQKGDFIARDPNDEKNKWLLTREQFSQHYEKASDAPVDEPKDEQPETTYQERVVKELFDLDTKIKKLQDFLKTKNFKLLEFIDRDILISQEKYMKKYYLCLSQRVDRFKPIEKTVDKD